MNAGFLAAGPVDLSRVRTRRALARVQPAARNWPAAFLTAGLVATALAAPLWPGLHEPLVWAALVTYLALLAALFVLATGEAGILFPPRRWAIFVLPAAGLIAAAFTLSGQSWPYQPAPPPTEAMAEALPFAAFWLALALSARATRAQAARRTMAAAIVFGAAGMAAAAIIGNPVETPGHPGLTGPFANRNAFALYLGLAILAALWLADDIKRHQFAAARPARLSGLAFWALGGALMLALILTQSRIGLLGMVVALVLLTLLADGRLRRRALCAVLLLAGTGALAGGAVAARFVQIRGDLAERMALYRQVGELIAEGPLFGAGPGAFPALFERAQRPPVDPGRVWDHAHSTYLNLWVEIGPVAGSVPLVAGLGLFLWLAVRAVRAGDRAAAMSAAALVLTACHSTIDFSLENPANTFVLAILIALPFGGQPAHRKTRTDR